LTFTYSFFIGTAPSVTYILSLHDALPIYLLLSSRSRFRAPALGVRALLRRAGGDGDRTVVYCALHRCERRAVRNAHAARWQRLRDRKSTRLNSSHEWISYAVFCLKKKKVQ